MDDLISRRLAIDAVGNCEPGEELFVIKSLPSIDAVKHGRWIPYGEVDVDGNQHYNCSECGCGETHVPTVEVRFCWNCGARMEREDE